MERSKFKLGYKKPHPMVSVEFNDPVWWKFERVSGKRNTYKIINTHPGKWKGASISWDTKKPHPMISLEFNDPVEWRMDKVSGKTDTYKIVSVSPQQWKGASISWDTATPHPMASLEFNDPVEWKLVPKRTSPIANHAPPNSNYRFCAREGGSCNYGGIVRIAYGVNGKFRYKSFRSRETGPGRFVSAYAACNSQNFGDPAPGIPKRCYILATNPGSSSGKITGQNVRIVRYNGGSFRQRGNGKSWIEYKGRNVEHARFTEIRRDSWNVYLRKSDGARIQLDLRNKVIKLNGRRLYAITNVWAP